MPSSLDILNSSDALADRSEHEVMGVRFGKGTEAIVLYKCRFGSFEREPRRASHRVDQVTFWKSLESQRVVERRRESLVKRSIYTPYATAHYPGGP